MDRKAADDEHDEYDVGDDGSYKWIAKKGEVGIDKAGKGMKEK